MTGSVPGAPGAPAAAVPRAQPHGYETVDDTGTTGAIEWTTGRHPPDHNVVSRELGTNAHHLWSAIGPLRWADTASSAIHNTYY